MTLRVDPEYNLKIYPSHAFGKELKKKKTSSYHHINVIFCTIFLLVQLYIFEHEVSFRGSHYMHSLTLPYVSKTSIKQMLEKFRSTKPKYFPKYEQHCISHKNLLFQHLFNIKKPLPVFDLSEIRLIHEAF